VKLYDAMAPHPRVVRMFLAEKQLEIPTVVLALGIGDTLSEANLARNPMGQVPVLELDSGQCISETLAICEYIEETHPQPPLIGATPEERADTRMWTRRVDLNICEPIYLSFRFGMAALRRFRIRAPVRMAEGSGREMKALASNHLEWLDREMAGRSYLCGERFTLADIHLYGFLSYGIQIGQPLDPQWRNVRAWFDRVHARPSAASSAATHVDPKAISGAI
jgi:glutathione S-transferase